MTTTDVGLIISGMLCLLWIAWMVVPENWKRKGNKTSRGKAVEVTSNSRGYRHIRSSIELSRDEMFDSLASAAAGKLGEPSLVRLDWLVTIHKDKSSAITKVSVEFYDDRNKKNRGKLWLVKG